MGKGEVKGGFRGKLTELNKRCFLKTLSWKHFQKGKLRGGKGTEKKGSLGYTTH